MTVLVLPGLLPYAEATALTGGVRRLAPVRGTPEAAWLGLPPLAVADGPLIVAALGAEPPERTMQFHLSVLGLDGVLATPPPPSREEESVLRPLLRRLDTKRLTAVPGEGLDHGLVLDGWWDLGTKSPEEALGRPMAESLPEGDLEPLLRRYLDDSVNLLSELAINERRRDEGIVPLNVLWPWGHGAPRRLTNLALLRGEALTVASDSLRMRGMARLAGYRPARLKGGLETDWTRLATHGVAALGAFVGLGEEEAVWLAERMGRGFEGRALIVAPSPEGGLVLETGLEGNAPFRADVAEDGSVTAVDLWEAVNGFLTSQPDL